MTTIINKIEIEFSSHEKKSNEKRTEKKKTVL